MSDSVEYTSIAMERFWQKVNKSGPIPVHQPELGECWLWLARLDRKGYGQFKLAGKDMGAHRAVLILEGKVLTRGMEVDHLCSNKSCVRPSHLEEVTPMMNNERGRIHRRGALACPSGHLYTPETVKILSNGKRACGICISNWNRYQREKDPAAKKARDAAYYKANAERVKKRVAAYKVAKTVHLFREPSGSES
jgi:hypothetical protein